MSIEKRYANQNVPAECYVYKNVALTLLGVGQSLAL